MNADHSAFDEPTSPIAGVLAEMERSLGRLPDRLRHHAAFLTTYHRTTRAVGKAIANGTFEDPRWVERWDVVFADLYLDALSAELGRGGRVSRPWQLAFSAPADLPPLRHVLLGLNAHVNYDLPQALLAVIGTEEFADSRLLDRRRRDHERLDTVLASRVRAEDQQLNVGGRAFADRLLAPINRAAAKTFLREGRQKVWQNAVELNTARMVSAEHYAIRLAELEVLSAAKIADLLRPGEVLIRLAVGGFGVTLPPPDSEPRPDE
jgi:Family of unknown function (DUF5995)